MTVPLVREENIFNAVKWLDRVGAAGGSVSNSVQLVFELLCTVCLRNPNPSFVTYTNSAA